eukprot:COSAG04_NODE_2642_length_3814_cov_3.078062_4_plen_152_part_00
MYEEVRDGVAESYSSLPDHDRLWLDRAVAELRETLEAFVYHETHGREHLPLELSRFMWLRAAGGMQPVAAPAAKGDSRRRRDGGHAPCEHFVQRIEHGAHRLEPHHSSPQLAESPHLLRRRDETLLFALLLRSRPEPRFRGLGVPAPEPPG